MAYSFPANIAEAQGIVERVAMQATAARAAAAPPPLPSLPAEGAGCQCAAGTSACGGKGKERGGCGCSAAAEEAEPAISITGADLWFAVQARSGGAAQPGSCMWLEPHVRDP